MVKVFRVRRMGNGNLGRTFNVAASWWLSKDSGSFVFKVFDEEIACKADDVVRAPVLLTFDYEAMTLAATPLTSPHQLVYFLAWKTTSDILALLTVDPYCGGFVLVENESLWEILQLDHQDRMVYPHVVDTLAEAVNLLKPVIYDGDHVVRDLDRGVIFGVRMTSDVVTIKPSPFVSLVNSTLGIGESVKAELSMTMGREVMHIMVRPSGVVYSDIPWFDSVITWASVYHVLRP